MKQRIDVALWRRHVEALEVARTTDVRASRLDLNHRLSTARAELERVRSVEYLGSLVGTLGADPRATELFHRGDQPLRAGLPAERKRNWNRVAGIHLWNHHIEHVQADQIGRKARNTESWRGPGRSSV